MRLTLRVGTRGSALARAQTRGVIKSLKKVCPSFHFRTVVIRTTGDEFQSVELFRKQGAGFFTSEIEKKLLAKEVDLAVHSLKDLPTDIGRGLVLAAFPKRIDPRDVLISKKGYTLASLPKRAVVGTGSPRRKRQLLRYRPDIELVDLRGNLDTRVKKTLKGSLDAVIVARAGLLRLKKYLRHARTLPASAVLPAVGQGALALEARAGDKELIRVLRRINDARTEKKVLAERAFLRKLRGGCRVPVGVHSEITNGSLHLRGCVFSSERADFVDGEISGPPVQYAQLGIRLAEKLLKKGAARLLREARHS